MKKQIIKKIIIISAALSVILFSSCKSADADNKVTDEKGRERIILAGIPEDVSATFYHDTVSTLVSRYNGASEKFYIEEKTYLSNDNLIMDLIGGERIDVIAVYCDMDISPLYSKGLLCDIYEFIDNDEDISRDTYVKPVLRSVEADGKLYEMPFDFTVLSAVAKEKLWGDDGDNSYEHIAEKAEALGIIPYRFYFKAFDSTANIIAEYVDFANGSCSFDSEEFREFIKFVKPYYNEIKNLSFEDLQEKFRNDEILVTPQYVGFLQQMYIERDVFDSVKYIGLPSKIENYHVAIPWLSFSIFTNSGNPEGAFDFIKYSTSYETYVEKSGGNEIPRMTSSPINQAALELNYNFYLETDLMGIEKEIRKKYLDEVMKQINSINGSGKTTCIPISDILSDELTSYFNDNKDINEVCRVIQDRVSTYLNERS